MENTTSSFSPALAWSWAPVPTAFLYISCSVPPHRVNPQLTDLSLSLSLVRRGLSQMPGGRPCSSLHTLAERYHSVHECLNVETQTETERVWFEFYIYYYFWALHVILAPFVNVNTVRTFSEENWTDHGRLQYIYILKISCVLLILILN